MYARRGPRVDYAEETVAHAVPDALRGRSARLLMEEMGCNLLFRWFVGLNAAEFWRQRPLPKIANGCRRQTGAKQYPLALLPSCARSGIADSAVRVGSLPLPARPTICCACETWPSQFRRCKLGPTCVLNSFELEGVATRTPRIKPFDIINR
jgi:hypothetical protein